MSFTNSAFTNPEQGLEQFRNYVTTFQVKQNWSNALVTDLVQLAEKTYDEVKSWFKTDSEEAREFWEILVAGAPAIFGENSNDQPTTIPKYNQFMTFLANASDTSFTIDEAQGVSGVLNVANEQFLEVAEKQKKENERWAKLLPFMVFGLGGVYIASQALPDIIESFTKK